MMSRRKTLPYFRSGVGTEAAWLDRISDPEVPSSRNHDRARNELCLFERSQKGCRLRVRVDNVIICAVHEKEPRRVLIHGCIADG